MEIWQEEYSAEDGIEAEQTEDSRVDIKMSEMADIRMGILLEEEE